MDKIVEKTVKATVVNDIVFPVRVRRIKGTEAAVRDLMARAGCGEVVVKGLLEKEICWVAGQRAEVDGVCYRRGKPYLKTVSEPFTEVVEFPGVREGMPAHAEARIMSIDYTRVDHPRDQAAGGMHHPCVLRQTAVLSICVRVAEIPPGPCPPPGPGPCPEPCIWHVIQPGDTFWLLSQHYGVPVEAIMQANPGLDPLNLQIGQRICIPCMPKG